MTGGCLDRQVTGVRRLTDDKGDSLGQLTDNRCRTQVSRRTRVLCSEDRQVFLLIHKGYCWINNAQLVMYHVVGSFEVDKQPPHYSQGVGKIPQMMCCVNKYAQNCQNTHVGPFVLAWKCLYDNKTCPNRPSGILQENTANDVNDGKQLCYCLHM